MIYEREILNLEKNFLEIIKNTYRTLMSRSAKGCYIFCCDKALSNYLKDRLSLAKPSHQHPTIKS
jgi:DUF2075 family protein